MTRKIALAVALLAMMLGVLIHGFGLFGGIGYMVSGGKGEGDILYTICLFYSAPVFAISSFCAFVSRSFWPKNFYLSVHGLTGLVFVQILVAYVMAVVF